MIGLALKGSSAGTGVFASFGAVVAKRRRVSSRWVKPAEDAVPESDPAVAELALDAVQDQPGAAEVSDRPLAETQNVEIEILYRMHREGLRRFFARNCGSEAVAQELAQEVWFKVIRAIRNNQFHAYGSFRSFLYRIARNQLIDWYRRKGICPEVEAHGDDGEGQDAIAVRAASCPDPEQIYAGRQMVKAVLVAIATLPEVQRVTLLMYLEGGMSYREIAEAMGTNRETVKSRLRYARALLREKALG